MTEPAGLRNLALKRTRRVLKSWGTGQIPRELLLQHTQLQDDSLGKTCLNLNICPVDSGGLHSGRSHPGAPLSQAVTGVRGRIGGRSLIPDPAAGRLLISPFALRFRAVQSFAVLLGR